MARLPFWLLQGAIHLDTDPIHARIYYDPIISNKDYIRDAVNPRSDVIDIGPRSWVFSDPAGDGSGPGWGLNVSNPNLLFTNYNVAQLGGHTVVLYNPVNQVIISTRALGAWTQDPRVESYARVIHLNPFFINQEVGGSDQHSYNALAMYLAGQINWPAIPWVCALLDATQFTITRTAVKYVSTIFDIPFAAIVQESYVPGCFVNQMGMGLSSPTRFDGVPAGRQLGGYALYNQNTKEVVRLQNFSGGGITTSGSNPVWVSDMRMALG